MPTFNISQELLNRNEISIIEVLVNAKIAPSKGQARILVEQGGISINDEKITDTKYIINKNNFNEDYFILKKGKKTFIKIMF